MFLAFWCFQLSFLGCYVLCHVLCLDLCFYMLICLDLYAQSFMLCFLLFHSSFCFMLMLGLCAHMLDIMSMVMLCSDLCVHVLFSMFYAQIYIHTCLYAWIHVLPCLCAKLLHVHTRVAMPMPRSIFHVLVRSMPCLCAQTQAMFVMPCAIVALLFILSHFLVFWPISSDLIQTLWSLSSSIYLGPYQRAWITLFFMSMLACFYVLCLCQPLQFQALPRLTPLAGLWLYGYIRRP